MKRTLLATTLLGFALCFYPAAVRCQDSYLPPEDYQKQLLAQRNAITNWANFSAANGFVGWEDGDLSQYGKHKVCDWTGVTCDAFDGSVTKLNLSCGSCAVQAIGTLAPELAEISSLQELYMSSQLFAGSLPDTWHQFNRLTTLVLDGNQLSGSLPASWGSTSGFPNLINLKLSNNLLSGLLPAAWGSTGAFRALKQMYLDFNMLTGDLPTSWASKGAFPQLKAVYLSNNNFASTLPPSWGNSTAFPSLTDLELAGCGMTGTLPPGWGSNQSFTNLFILELALNDLDGSLPPEWGTPGAFPSLSSLSLSNNKFEGTIPAAWADPAAFPKLEAVGLGNNPSLCGPVPASLYSAVCSPLPFGTDCVGTDLPACTASFPPATQADVASILAQKDAISNWDAVFASQDLSGWNQTVAVCDWTGVACTANGSIVAITLSCPTEEQVQSGLGGAQPCGARAIGTLAAELASIKTLQSLNLINLGLSGTLPEAWAAIGTFENLNELYIDSNDLSGPLPEAWASPGSFPRLQAMSLSSNMFNGTLPASWGNSSAFPTAKSMFFMGNKLSGPLPDAWGSPKALPFLAHLDISNNSIDGTLPSAWGQNGSFRSMNEMHMDDNRLAGSLPDSWGVTGAFSKLTYLSLKNNSLIGSIPTAWNTTDSLPALQELYLSGNSELCGSVPYTMLNPVCGTEPSQCEGNQLVCAAPSPASTPPAPDTTSSSTPVGAIVGGVVGGLAVLAVLAFLALRPRKGWLTRRAAVASAKLDSDRTKLPNTSIPIEKQDDDDGFDDKGIRLAPAVDPSAFTALPADSQDELAEGRLPFSYITTAGYGKPVSVGGRTPSGAPASSQSDSLHSLESDPVLSLISTRLATLRQRTRSATLSPASSSGLTSSSAPLPAEVQQWEVAWDHIQLERSIGRGSFGRVYLANWNATPVAVKILINADGVEQTPDLELPDEVMKQLQEEAVVMSRMRHPNLVSFLGLCTLPPCILTEYCSRGSLYDVLRQASYRPEVAAELTWRRRLNMAFDAARGLLYLHLRTPPIIHNDVKSPNCLVDQNWQVKVCDFNLSEILRHQPAAAPLGPDATNPTWLAPEVLSGGRSTWASDVYSYALVLWELLTWKLPWARQPLYQVRRAVLEGKRPELPAREQLPGPDNDTFVHLDAYCQLMSDCWAQNPDDRPTFADIVSRLSAMLELASPLSSIGH